MMQNLGQQVGVVAIGRNEGARLKACLESVTDLPRVYVDSGSTDGSVEFAESIGVQCVTLDLSIPFTAARARNAGFSALLEANPDLNYVMFVDGDCVIESGWIDLAVNALAPSPDAAVVCGRRKERYPQSSIYNLLCDIEWDTPIGEVKACGGDALYRVEVFRSVNGFDPSFIAGEEPELCFRIRQKGLKVLRIDALMTLHDADMEYFSQWWYRVKRSGYAYWLNAHKHSRSTSEKFKAKEVSNILMWGGLLCLTIILTVGLPSLIPVVLFLGFVGIQYVRLIKYFRPVRADYGRKAQLLFVALMLLGKLPQLFGVIQGMYKSCFSKPHTLVEYK